MSKVYIVNKSAHDFSSAEKFGKLVFLSEGPMSRLSTNNMVRHFWPVLRESSPHDYIIPSGLTNMSLIATSIFAWLHGRVNLLLYMRGRYVPRVTLLEELLNDLPNSEGPNLGHSRSVQS